MANMNFEALQAVFSSEEIEWRLQQAGEKNGRIWAMCVPYVTNRAIQQRLDEVLGPENWKNEFREGPGGGVLCGLSVKVDGEWVTKWDGAENTDIEGVKGGLSGAMKRAAVQWGIGRYLYALDESFASVHDGGKFRGKTKDNRSFKWDPPQLPAWALPKPRSAGRKADSLARVRQEHEAMLEFVKAVGSTVDDDVEIRIAGKAHKLKTFVRESWSGMKEEIRVARTVVKAIEEATGMQFERQAA